MRARLPTIFILLTVMIDAMGIGLIMPVMPDLLQEVQGAGLANAALWGGVLSTGYAVMQFLFGPVIGNLSDRFGRRPVLLLSLFVMALDYVVMAVAGSIWLLFGARLVGGITAATHSTASAFMADTLPPKNAARALAWSVPPLASALFWGRRLAGCWAIWAPARRSLQPPCWPGRISSLAISSCPRP